MNRPTRIFLSYGRGDDDPDYYDPSKSFVRRLYNALSDSKFNFELWWDREDMPSRALTFIREIRDAVDACDKLLLVVGEKSMTSEYVRAEWEHALNTCKNVVPILRNGDYTLIPFELSLFHAPDFRDDAFFDHKLDELVGILSQSTAPMGALYGVPTELPKGYIQRKSDLQEVSAMIRSDSVKPTVVTATSGRTTALYGLGGIGKSTLVQALSYDCDVRRTFPDGIIWIEIGKNPLIPLRQGDVGAIYGDSRAEYLDETRGKSRLGHVLSDKRTLLILDDVWEQKHVEPFRVIGQGCRLLITTRNQRLARRLSANDYSIDKLTEDQGIELIAARFSKKSDEISETTNLRQIVQLLSGHTQAISIAAAKLEEFGLGFAPRYLERMRKRLDGDNPFKDLILEETDKNLNLELSLSLSYEDLRPDLQRRFRALGILSPDGNFDISLIAAIWGDAGSSFEDTEDALNELTQATLLTRDTTRYSQHSLLRAYARALMLRENEFSIYAERYINYITDFSVGFRKLSPENWSELEVENAHIHYIGDELFKRYSADEELNNEFRGQMLRFCINILPYLHLRGEVNKDEWLQMGQHIANQRNDKGNEASFLNEIGLTCMNLSRHKKALKYYNDALYLFQDIQDKRGEAETLNHIGWLHLVLGNKVDALNSYTQAQNLFCAVDDKVGEATSLNHIGLLLYSMGKNDEALSHYEQAMSLRQGKNDLTGNATTLSNIGLSKISLGKYREALDYYEKSLSLTQATKDKNSEAIVRYSMGRTFSMLGEKDKALEYYKRACKLFHEVWNFGDEARVLQDIGAVYTDLGKPEEALHYFQQSLVPLQKVGNKKEEATSLNWIGKFNFESGNIREAIENFDLSIKLYQSIRDVPCEAQVRFNRALALEKINRIAAITETNRAITLLKKHRLQVDAANQPIAKYEAFLAYIRSKK